MGEVDQPFKIFEEIPPSCHNMLDDAPVVNGCLMNIEYVDGPHPLDILQAAQSEKKERSEMDNLQEVAEERDKFDISVFSFRGYS